MKTIDVRITDDQLKYLQRVSGKRSVVYTLSDMIQEMLNAKMLEEKKDGEGKTVSD